MQNLSHIPLAFWGLTTPVWIALWSVLALSTIGLIVLVRTRWSNNRTWRMCGILSLWVHVLIVVFSMTVRIVTGPPIAGDGGPIRVAVIAPQPITALDGAETSDEIAPAFEELTAPPLVAPQAEPLVAEAAEPEQRAPDVAAMKKLIDSFIAAEPLPPAPVLEAPALLAAPIPQEVANADDKAEIDEKLTDDEPKDESKSKPDPALDQLAEKLDPPVESYPEVVPPTSVASKPPAFSKFKASAKTKASKSSEPIPNLYADRFAEDLTELATERGGSSQTEASVKAALAWLAANQSADGGWDASNFGAVKSVPCWGTIAKELEPKPTPVSPGSQS